MLRAIIFDFNGVLADDETPHFLCFRQALASEGLELSKEDYYGLYLGMDERSCASALLAEAGRDEPAALQRIVARKEALFQAYQASRKPPLFRGVVEFVREASRCVRLAVASGGRRAQIEFALAGTPIERDLQVIVAAEDVPIGKPDPMIYRLALARLNERRPRPDPPIIPGECLVIEDSLAGIQSAKAAGMKVVAVSTTYLPERLTGAHLVLPGLEGVSLESLQALFPSERTGR